MIGGATAIRRRPGGAVPAGRGAALSIGLSAAIIAASEHEPRVLTIRRFVAPGRDAVEALPAGPLEAEHLYTFGDRDRLAAATAAANPALTVAYLALVREVRPAGSAEAVWQNWYRYFPWEDWRDGKPASLAPVETGLAAWAAEAPNEA